MEKPYNSVTVRTQHEFVYTNSMLNHIASQFHVLYDYIDSNNTYRILIIYGRVKRSTYMEQVCIHLVATENGAEFSVHSIPPIVGIFEIRERRWSRLLETILQNFPNAECEKHYITDSQIKKDKNAVIKAIIFFVVAVLCVELILFVIGRICILLRL